MLRAVLTVIILLILCGYVALFLSWNATPRPIVTLQLGGATYEQPMPVGFLFIIGVLVGAVAMALALWSPWNALKANEAQQRELIQRARARLKSQEEKIKELTRALEESAARTEQDEKIALPTAAQAALAEVEASAATEDSEGESKPPTSQEADPEVI